MSHGSHTPQSRQVTRDVADDIARELQRYCQRTEDASVLQHGLVQLRWLMELSFDDAEWQPPI